MSSYDAPRSGMVGYRAFATEHMPDSDVCARVNMPEVNTLHTARWWRQGVGVCERGSEGRARGSEGGNAEEDTGLQQGNVACLLVCVSRPGCKGW
jgi:hypothetical protein